MKVECMGGPLDGQFVEYPGINAALETRLEHGVEMAYWIIEEPEERIPVYVWHKANTEPDRRDWFPHAY